ncbi:glycogen synthase GlgA [Chakrabartyella piscis]|uniref:glycogen synthase GlgA n=1 Tax=Chakrabartyella piscis TaxID=2918914 RepID=UPI00295851EE|nr:glycogen synthase GlgA [Chakrabartyella piscis]
MNPNLKVLIVASESAPYVKSGGLGDVVGSLPKALKEQGVDVRVVIPRHMSIKNSEMEGVEFLGEFDVHLSWRTQKAKVLVKRGDVPVYFIENDFYFGRGGLYGYGDDNERFAFFGKAVLDMMSMLDFYPDVLHCNDWQTGPVCLYLNEIYKKMVYYSKIKTVFTIHNLQYQGNFDKSTMELLGVPYYCYENGKVEFFGSVSFMKMGLMYADHISTVSGTYAEEIQTWEYAYGMDGILRSRNHVLSGIVNGIDYTTNNPETDKRLPYSYTAKKLDGKAKNKLALQERLGLEQRDVPVIGMITRLADQKGIDILSYVFDELMQRDVQFVLLGTGESRFEYFFREMQNRYPHRVSANIFFDEALAQQIYAGSDLFMMPSRFEPCGLGQMFSLRHGTVPIVRKTGGLADTIQPYSMETKEGNGFLFENYDGGGILWATDQALEVYWNGKEEWNQVVVNAMNSDYSWSSSALEYIKLYESLLDPAE